MQENNLRLYDAPVFVQESKDYYVELNGRRAFVHPVTVSSRPTNELYRGVQRGADETEQASLVNFDFSGRVRVRVLCGWEIFNARVLPAAKGVVPQRSERNKGDEVSFELTEPGQYVLEINGLHRPLHILANEMETLRPDPAAPNVQCMEVEDKPGFLGNYAGDARYENHSGNHGVQLKAGCDTLYFGPGVHHVDRITLKSGQSVYIDGGAVVYGVIHATRQKDIRVYGRGILDGSRFSRDYIHSGLCTLLLFEDCENVEIEGIVIRDSAVYNLATVAGSGFHIHNVKIFSWRRNSDGMDFHNTRDIHLHDCFLRCFDDSVVLKGEEEYLGYPTGHAPMEHVLVERCVIWGDWGRALEIGAETSAQKMCDIVFRDCDVIHFAFVACDVQACGDAPVRDVTFENIRIGDPIDPLIGPRLMEIFIRKMMWMPRASLGSVRNVVFRDISYNGLVVCPCRFIGWNEEHDMANIRLENITLNGDVLLDEAHPLSPIILNAFAKDVFLNGNPVCRDRAILETEADTCNSFLVGNGAFLKL